MYTLLISLLLTVSLSLPASDAGRQKNSTDTHPVETVSIDFTQRYQTLEGWGSSLCWWAAQVGNWDEKKVDEIVDIITSPDKLNMNIFRYNIGGGDDPAHTDGHMVKGKGKRAEMEGFKASPDTPYDWSADQGQRAILLKIKEKRADAIFEAFSNSAPYWMTYSGCAAGNTNPLDDNLKPEYYEMFCDYLLDVCKQYDSKYNIRFKTLEPFNESYSNYWYANGSQEGCHFSPESQMKIIRMLYPKLQASGLPTVISASDETNLNQFLTVQKAYLQAGDIMDKLGQLNTHTYSGTNTEREEVRNLISQTDKPFWQSETGPSGGEGFDSNLLLTQKLFDDMRIMRPQAWLDWQLVEEHNDVWCLFRGNFKTQEYQIVKNLYVRMQITRFFKQGYTLIETNNPNALAAIAPDGKTVVVAVLNTAATEQTFIINVDKYPSPLSGANVWRTSEKEDCAPVQSIRIKDNCIDYNCPARSLTTFILN